MYKVQYYYSKYDEWVTAERCEDYADSLEAQAEIENMGLLCRVVSEMTDVVVYKTEGA